MLRCLGSSQRLRTRYGHGFQIEIGMMIPESTEIAAQTSAIIATLARTTPTPADDGSEVPLSRPEVLRSFDALGKTAWAGRLTTSGTGAEVQAALDGNGHVAAAALASW